MNHEHEPVLPADRHQLLRGHLMSEINRENAPRRSPARRYGWVALPALAGGLALVMVLGGGGGGQAPARPPVAAGTFGSPSATAESGPVQLLDRIAQVAASKPAPEVKDHQFVYVKSVVRFPDHGKDGMIPGTLHEREVWLSVDGKRDGLLYEPAKFGKDERGANPDGTLPLGSNRAPNLLSPTYRYLAGLPTDPQALLQKIVAERTSEKTKGELLAFDAIGALLREQIAPPGVSAALYRAAALIPGVELIDSAPDARGRTGVAVGWTNSAGVRAEWIFDRDSHEYLGERLVVVRAGSSGKPGDVIGETAVLTRAVVDKAGDRP